MIATKLPAVLMVKGKKIRVWNVLFCAKMALEREELEEEMREEFLADLEAIIEVVE